VVSAACYAELVRSKLVGRSHLFLLVSALFLTAGCGYIGNPIYPLANIPTKISDLSAVQRGSSILVHYSLPTFTTENNPITTGLHLDLRIGVAGDHFNPSDWPGAAKSETPQTIKGGVATYVIPTKDWTGKKIAIAARSSGANRKPSDWSNFEILPVVAAPQVPSKPVLQNTASGLHVTWTGPGDQFRILRKVADEKDYMVANTVAGHEWTDTGVEYGRPYTYEVQAQVNVGDKKIAESDLSEPETATPVDEFPPAVPSALRADRSGNAVALVWEPDSDADLAGYRIYRSEGSGPWQRVAETSTVPSYSDTTVEHGKTYHYAVTAFDNSPRHNESQRSSPPVEIAIP
jgi:hypothetical protein